MKFHLLTRGPEALTGVIVGQEQLRTPECDRPISFSCLLTQLFSKVVSIWHKALCRVWEGLFINMIVFPEATFLEPSEGVTSYSSVAKRVVTVFAKHLLENLF